MPDLAHVDVIAQMLRLLGSLPQEPGPPLPPSAVGGCGSSSGGGGDAGALCGALATDVAIWQARLTRRMLNRPLLAHPFPLHCQSCTHAVPAEDASSNTTSSTEEAERLCQLAAVCVCMYVCVGACACSCGCARAFAYALDAISGASVLMVQGTGDLIHYLKTFGRNIRKGISVQGAYRV